jgi:hypothetical protein
MKRWTILLVVGVAALSLAVPGTVYAQEEPAVSGGKGPGDGTGILHDYMVEAFADALGIAADDLEARLASGETLAAVALDLGVSAEEFPALWLEARQSALDAAVADGVITAEQAEWMLSRMQAGNRGAAGYGFAGAGMMGGARGLRMGGGTGTCPWAQQ